MAYSLNPTEWLAPALQPVNLAAIDQELSRFWYHAVPAESGQPVTRACMANLVIFCRNSREEEEMTAEIPGVVARHPSRVLLLVADASQPTAELEAFVSAHCRLIEEGRQICSEHITIRTGAAGLRRLPSTVRSLLLGDLETALWWVPPEAPPAYGALFEELAQLADQVIYDSVAWTDPLHQLMTTASWIGHGQAKSIADLAWRRPRLWRRLIAQSLDPAYAPGALEGISEISIEHGPHALTQAWLLIGWLALRLGWQPQGGKVAPGPEVQWQFAWPHGTPRVRIRRLASGDATLQTLRVLTRVAEQPVTFHFRAEHPGRVSVFAEGFADRMLALTGPVQSRAEMVARQLPDLAPDRLFEESMTLARTMAAAVR
ncbi:MAG: glucose-6-phosphate dehydrogenase assembly protein OpcA [Candidatus Tectimicrobiota bacterium]